VPQFEASALDCGKVELEGWLIFGDLVSDGINVRLPLGGELHFIA
jgi:hypothetical protein